MAQVVFTDAAIDDLRRMGPDTVPKVMKKLRVLLHDPLAGYPLGGELTGFRKLVVGRNTWRVVYRVADDDAIEVCQVWAVGARADAQVYAQALARLRDAREQRPEFHRLAEVVERLGRLSDVISAAAPVAREPLPDWLATRLVHTAGIPPQEVAAMDLQEAVDRWAEYVSKPG